MLKCALCERENPKVSDNVLSEGSWICKRCSRKSVLDGDHAEQVLAADDVILKELLTCVSFYFENSSSDTIKNVLRNFFHTREVILSAAERRGTPVLLSATVSENFGNSPQVAIPRRPREIDQSTQRFHVGCDNRTIFVLTPSHAM